MFNILQHWEFDLRLSWTFSSSGKNLSEENSNISSLEVKLYTVCSYVKQNQSYSLKNSLANTFCNVCLSTEPVTDSVGKKRQVICPCNSFLRSPSSSHCEWRAPASCASVCPLCPGPTGLVFAAPTPFSRSKICDISAVSPHHGRFVTRPTDGLSR